MPIRQKVLVLIITLNTLTFLTLYLIVWVLLSGKFAEIEKQNAHDDLIRIEQGLNSRIKSLGVLVEDWSVWDDSYEFVLGNQPDYSEKNIPNSVFENVNVNLIAFYDINQNLTYGMTWDRGWDKQKPVPGELNEVLIKTVGIVKNSEQSGLLQTPLGILYFATHPILKSDGSGPSVGNIIMGKLINFLDIAAISDTTNLTFDFYSPNLNPTRYNELIKKYNLLSEDKVSVGRETLNGYKLLKDINNNPSLLIDLRSYRDINSHAIQLYRLLLLSYLISTFVFIFVAIIFIDKILIKPISEVHDDVKNITIRKDFSVRLKKYAAKEFNELSQSINKMLDDLNLSEKNLLETNQRLKKESEELAKKTSELERLNQHLVGREVRMSELKKELIELKGIKGNDDK